MPDGSVYALLSSAADNDGERVEFEFVLPPGCVAPPPHVHAELTEEYEVLEGRFDVMVGGEWTTLGPGQAASVPPGALRDWGACCASKRLSPARSVLEGARATERRRGSLQDEWPTVRTACFIAPPAPAARPVRARCR